jgi:hypothetical protein
MQLNRIGLSAPLSAVAIVLLGSSLPSALAAPISVNFGGNSPSGSINMASTDVAGLPAYADDNWNNFGGNSTFSSTDVVDGDGNLVPGSGGNVQFAYSSAGFGGGPDNADAWNTSTDASFGTNAKMFDGIVKRKSGGSTGEGITQTFTFTNVPTGLYDLILYVADDNPAKGKNISVTSTGTTYYYNAVDIVGTPVFTPVTSTVSGSPTTDGNYVLFAGISPALGNTISVTLSNTKESSEPDDATLGVAGLQLVAVPEPTSIAAIGVAGLLGLRRRRCK